jgi:sugar lactone lactonase YvrE
MALTNVEPLCVVEGGRLSLHGSGFPVSDVPPDVSIGGVKARVAFASSRRLTVVVPSDIEGGRLPVRVADLPGETAFVSIGRAWATGLHQVDNPVFDAEGSLYVTYSGSRGQESPVSIFRVTAPGTREPFASGIVNATSMAIGPDGSLYVSSRFEGSIYKVRSDGSHDVVASDLGVACGIAFDSNGSMYVGDRTGTIFRLRSGRVERFATLRPSVAAFHLAMSPEDELCVAAPTLAPYDHVYRIGRDGEVRELPHVFGRPQGITFDHEGTLHVVDALAGACGLFAVRKDAPPELRVAGASLVGVALGPRGELVVSSNETAYRCDC